MHTVNYKGASEITGLAERTLRNMVSKKMIPHYKIGRSVRFSVDKLSVWLEQRSVPELKKTINGEV